MPVMYVVVQRMADSTRPGVVGQGALQPLYNGNTRSGLYDSLVFMQEVLTR